MYFIGIHKVQENKTIFTFSKFTMKLNEHEYHVRMGKKLVINCLYWFKPNASLTVQAAMKPVNDFNGDL